MSALVDFDTKQFCRNFDRRPFRVSHRLSGHALFDLKRLALLAREMPAEKVEYNAGDVPVNLHPSRTPQNGLGPEETVHCIEECQSWMVLKNVERVPEYGALLERCLGEIRQRSDASIPGTHLTEAFVFVSSPRSVTPFHIDPEHNFLFQICGRKTIYVFDPADREIVTEADLEKFYGGAHRNLRFREEWQPRAMRFDLEENQGVHVPVTAPHWVKNGDEVSVSFSVTFRSRHSKRRAEAYQMNHRLRRIGLRPAPVGCSTWSDLAKQGANRIIRRVTSGLRRPAPRAGRPGTRW